MVLSARHACLLAAALFAGLALLIARLAVAPLGAADLLGIAACAAAAGAFATLGFTNRPAALSSEALAAQVAAAVEARLRPAATPAQPEAGAADSRPPLTAAEIPAPAAGAKPRLGRGLAGLMHHPSALAKPPAPENREAA